MIATRLAANAFDAIAAGALKSILTFVTGFAGPAATRSSARRYARAFIDWILPDWHRRQFKEVLGWSYAEFDQAWADWAQVAYKPGVPKGGESMPQLPGGLPPAGGGDGG